MTDRPRLFVETDHNPDEVRSFYEIPDAIARRIQPEGDRRTFAQCLADLLPRKRHTLTDEDWAA